MRAILSLLSIPLRNFFLMKKYRNQSLKIGLFSRIRKCRFGNFNTIYHFVELTQVELGDFTYIANGSKITRTQVGNFCSIGPGVLCGLGKHPSRDFITTHPAFFSLLKQAQKTFVKQSLFEEYQDIKIGHDVWVGANVIILDGVKIGNGVIIGAGSVVTKDIPSYAIVGGNPAKIIRYRFDQEEQQFLEQSEWWHKDVAWLHQNAKNFKNFNSFRSCIESNE